MVLTKHRGYLKGGFEEWKKEGREYDTITSIPATTFEKLLKQQSIPVFDVRKEGEYLSEHVQSAHLTPLVTLTTTWHPFQKTILSIYIVQEVTVLS